MAKARRGRMVESCILDEDWLAGWDRWMRGGLFGIKYVCEVSDLT